MSDYLQTSGLDIMQTWRQCWALQIYTQFQNCKSCSETANPQVCNRFVVTFRTSATANAHCTSANLDRNIYCYIVLVMTFWRSNFAVAQTVTSKKKIINTRMLTSDPKNKTSTSKRFYYGTGNIAYCFADLR